MSDEPEKLFRWNPRLQLDTAGRQYRRRRRTGYVKDRVAYLPTASNELIMLDPEDLSWAEQFSWRCARSTKTSYKSICTSWNTGNNKRVLSLARMLLGLIDKSLCVDHINGDTLDNRRANLRVITQHANKKNRGSTTRSRSGIVGISQTKTGWLAHITTKGKNYSKHFPKLQEAIAWRNRRARELFGTVAREVPEYG